MRAKLFFVYIFFAKMLFFLAIDLGLICCFIKINAYLRALRKILKLTVSNHSITS